MVKTKKKKSKKYFCIIICLDLVVSWINTRKAERDTGCSISDPALVRESEITA